MVEFLNAGPFFLELDKLTSISVGSREKALDSAQFDRIRDEIVPQSSDIRQEVFWPGSGLQSLSLGSLYLFVAVEEMGRPVEKLSRVDSSRVEQSEILLLGGGLCELLAFEPVVLPEKSLKLCDATRQEGTFNYLPLELRYLAGMFGGAATSFDIVRKRLSIQNLLLQLTKFYLHIQIATLQVPPQLIRLFQCHFVLNIPQLFEELHICYFVLFEEAVYPSVEGSPLLIQPFDLLPH